MDSIKLNSGFTAAWFNIAFSEKYALPVLVVETVKPPRIGINSKPESTSNTTEVTMRLPPGWLSLNPLNGAFTITFINIQDIKAVIAIIPTIPPIAIGIVILAIASLGDERK